MKCHKQYVRKDKPRVRTLRTRSLKEGRITGLEWRGKGSLRRGKEKKCNPGAKESTVILHPLAGTKGKPLHSTGSESHQIVFLLKDNSFLWDGSLRRATWSHAEEPFFKKEMHFPCTVKDTIGKYSLKWWSLVVKAQINLLLPKESTNNHHVCGEWKKSFES